MSNKNLTVNRHPPPLHIEVSKTNRWIKLTKVNVPINSRLLDFRKQNIKIIVKGLRNTGINYPPIMMIFD